jgi:hypothetical protein
MTSTRGLRSMVFLLLEVVDNSANGFQPHLGDYMRTKMRRECARSQGFHAFEITGMLKTPSVGV